MSDDVTNSLENKIWFTRKTRIRTSERLQSNHFHSNLILIWYSLFTFLLAIYLIKFPKLFSDSDVIMTILTGAVFSLSLFIPQLNLSARYEKVKKNYILLDDLLFELKFKPNKQELLSLNDRYLDLLDSVENHSNMDYLYFLHYESGDKCSATISTYDWFMLQVQLAVRAVTLTTLYIAPILFLMEFI
ncbi:SLATT domain-containing protein [Vibrio sp. L5-1]|uniref:SLATT domain-containing protein n=1 Tax=Vibrio sp. L5-1 TaxID=2912254 RepID=UPI001F48B411|nr:SLATT domain-containing protein [Vibrio sp. L5-1]MCF7493614.1 SLATT domain-containing protein [Vibrio sp. L5-1]